MAPIPAAAARRAYRPAGAVVNGVIQHRISHHRVDNARLQCNNLHVRFRILVLRPLMTADFLQTDRPIYGSLIA